MDYKTFIHSFDVNKKELVEFINLRNKRNISRLEEMVNGYIAQMASGDYSIKSYKAKIIHNELDCNHAIRDVVPIKDKVITKLLDLIDNYFAEYLDSRVDENLPKQKAKDMRDFIQENRRQKHDVLLKKNNTDKDFNAKSKELESEKKDKLNSYNEKINSLKMRLVNDLKRQSEKTIKDYQEYELALLDNDDKKKIKELKEKIKEIRKKSLDEEYNIKMNTYDEILNEELSFTKSYQEFIYELEKYRKEMKETLAELERDNNLLTIDNDYQDKLYDIKQEKKANDRFYNEIKKYESLVKEHNAFLNQDYNEHEYTISEKMFVYDLAKLHVYDLLLKVHYEDKYDPFGNFLINLNNLIDKEKQTYQDMLEAMKPLRKKEASELTTALDGFVASPKKKLTKEELTSNVLESLDRYYANFIKEIDFYNLVYSDLLFNIVKALEEGFKNKVNSKFNDSEVLDDVTNYDYIDLANYGYKSEREEIVVEAVEGEVPLSHSEKLELNLNNYLNELLNKYEVEKTRIDNLLNELNNEKKAQDDDFKQKCEQEIILIDEEYETTVTKNKKELLTKEKEVTKATSKSKDKAKKLLIESLKAL